MGRDHEVLEAQFMFQNQALLTCVQQMYPQCFGEEGLLQKQHRDWILRGYAGQENIHTLLLHPSIDAALIVLLLLDNGRVLTTRHPSLRLG